VDTIVETRTDPDSKLDIDPVCGMTVYRTQAREHDPRSTPSPATTCR